MLPPEYGLKFEFSQLIYEALQILFSTSVFEIHAK